MLAKMKVFIFLSGVFRMKDGRPWLDGGVISKWMTWVWRWMECKWRAFPKVEWSVVLVNRLCGMLRIVIDPTHELSEGVGFAFEAVIGELVLDYI